MGVGDLVLELRSETQNTVAGSAEQAQTIRGGERASKEEPRAGVSREPNYRKEGRASEWRRGSVQVRFFLPGSCTGLGVTLQPSPAQLLEHCLLFLRLKRTLRV